MFAHALFSTALSFVLCTGLCFFLGQRFQTSFCDTGFPVYLSFISNRWPDFDSRRGPFSLFLIPQVTYGDHGQPREVSGPLTSIRTGDLDAVAAKYSLSVELSNENLD